MSWLDRLLGREKRKAAPDEPATFSPHGWEALSEDRRALNSRRYLERLAGALGVTEPRVVPRPADRATDLRGSVGGFPLLVTVDHAGQLVEVSFRYANTGLGRLELAYDPEAAALDATRDARVTLGPQVFVEGEHANAEAARFRELPEPLQRRVVGEMRRLRVRHLRSRTEELALAMHDGANLVADPVQWLGDALALALELSGARGAVPSTPKGKPRGSDPAQRGTDLAAGVARLAPGATLARRPNEEIVEVRWTEQGIDVCAAIDLARLRVMVSAEARDDADPRIESVEIGAGEPVAAAAERVVQVGRRTAEEIARRF